MKKAISVILASALVAACLASLGGCGEAAPSGKEGFFGAETYFSDFAEVMASPMASIDLGGAKPDELTPVKSSTAVTVSDLSVLEALYGTAFPVPFTLSSDTVVLPESEQTFSSLVFDVAGDSVTGEAYTDAASVTFTLPELLDAPVYLLFSELTALAASSEEANELAAELPDGVSEFVPSEIISLDTLERLYVKYWTLFKDSIAEDCFADGSESFRTADGEKKLDTVTLTLDAGSLRAALEPVVAELKNDADVAELIGKLAQSAGESADEYIADFHTALDEICAEEDATIEDGSLVFTRFIKNGAFCGDRISFTNGEETLDLELGCTEGKSGRLAFVTLTDETGAQLLSAECEDTREAAKLTVVISSGEGDTDTVKLVIDGTTEETDEGNKTVATYKISVGGVTLKLLDTAVTVREFSAGKCDVSADISMSVSSVIFGGDGSGNLGMKLRLDTEWGPIASGAQMTAPDAAGAYTCDYLIANRDIMKASLTAKLQAEHPRIAEFIACCASMYDNMEDTESTDGAEDAEDTGEYGG